MRHPERLSDYLEHIVEAIERAVSYLEALQNFEAFEQSRQLQDAVVRNIEIIGEAVNQIQRVAPDFIDRHPEVPWPQMGAMRNRMIHGYFLVDPKIVWTTVKNDLPRLRQQIDDLLTELRCGLG